MFIFFEQIVSNTSDFKNIQVYRILLTDELIGKKFANKNLNLSLYKSQFKIEKSKLAKQLIDSLTTSYKKVVDKK